jgi:hypothetical protein
MGESWKSGGSSDARAGPGLSVFILLIVLQQSRISRCMTLVNAGRLNG